MEEKETHYDMIYVIRSLNSINEYSVCDVRTFVITFMSSGAHQQQPLNRTRARMFALDTYKLKFRFQH